MLGGGGGRGRTEDEEAKVKNIRKGVCVLDRFHLGAYSAANLNYLKLIFGIIYSIDYFNW